MSRFSYLMELLHNCYLIFDKVGLSCIDSINLTNIVGYHLLKPEPSNLEIREISNSEGLPQLIIDLYNADLDGELFYETNSYIDIDFSYSEEIYQEYTNNGEASAVLMYGRDILNMPSEIISNIKFVIRIYNEIYANKNIEIDNEI